MNRRQIVAKQREDGNAIHHGRLEQKLSPMGNSETIQFFVGVNDGAFIGGDGVRAHFQSGANMINRRLTVAWAERRRFKENVGLRQTQPAANIMWRGSPRPRR